MAKPMTPTITATYSSDSYIVLNINGVSDNSARTVDRLYISRWNQYDGTWGAEHRHDSPTYNGGSPGSTGPNRKYRWRVRGWIQGEGYGDYAYSDFVQTSPNAPNGAAAWLSGPAAISMAWNETAAAINYDYATEVWWNINGGGWGHVTTVPAGVNSHYIPNLTPGATFQFGFRHVDTYGEPVTASAFVYTGTVTSLTFPNATGAVTATRNSDSTATLTWANNSNAGAPYDSITVQRWDSVSNAWGTIANVSGGATTVTDSGLVAGRKYQWRTAANNVVGSSNWVYSGNVFTTPSAPSNVVARYTGGTSVSVSWVNNVTYPEYGLRVQTYKNGVADGAVVSLNAETTSYTKTSVDVLATYSFKVWAVSNTGSLTSTQTESNSVMPAAPPLAPTGLAMSAAVVDLALPYTLSWTHAPSVDGSAQTKFIVRHREVGTTTWTTNAAVTSSTTSVSRPFGNGYANGATIEWQVRTYGVHPTPSPYSGSALLYTSTTPTVNITSPGATVVNSTIPIAWSYFDEQGTPQAEYKIEIYESASGKLVAAENGASSISSLSLATTVTDGLVYRLEVSVRDGSGLWSTKASKTFTAAFTPPAEVLLSPELDTNSGAGILTLVPTPHDDGLTTYPASAVTIERRFWDDETETYGDWEVLVSEAPPEGVLIDTTGPAHDDGEYRVITHSAAPSTRTSSELFRPPRGDQRWVYVGGGPKFDVVCKMWANIEISQKASRAKALHYFAGRKHPVIYTGEAAERTFTISGILEDEASPPAQWMRLARMGGPVLLRAPGRRMFGSLSEVQVDRIQHNLHKVSFSIQEVDAGRQAVVVRG